MQSPSISQETTIVERQATSMRQAETEPKPVQKKEPSTHTHTCTPKMTNPVNERQPRGVEDRPKHTTPRTTHRKTSQGRGSRAQGAQRLSIQWKKEPSKPEAKKGKRDMPKAHNVYYPKGKEPADKGTQPSRDSGKTRGKSARRPPPQQHTEPTHTEGGLKGTGRSEGVLFYLQSSEHEFIIRD